MPAPPPLGAAAGVADVLVSLFVVLLAAKVGDELFRRLGQPTIVGEILAGVALIVGLCTGPAAFAGGALSASPLLAGALAQQPLLVVAEGAADLLDALGDAVVRDDDAGRRPP